MRRFLLFCLLWMQWALTGTGVAADPAFLQEVRMIRRAYLDTLGLLPTREELEWYLVYNQNGYSLAVNFLMQRGPVNGLDAARLVSAEYRDQEERPVPKSVLKRNVAYLAGVYQGGETDELFEKASLKLIEDAMKIGEGYVSGAIDYLVQCLTCRPATLVEVNELSAIFNQVSRKSEDEVAWKTVLAHVMEMHDSKYK
ncbi:MAG: hypothetical protein RLZZ142_2556 [Verrucomicrobiota bacterium]